MSISKIAVDSAAKAYWELLYKEYGKQLTRDIPRRIKKAMLEHKNAKIAAIDVEPGIVTPIAHAITKAGLVLEGLFTPPTGHGYAFQAVFDNNGNLAEFQPIALAASAPSKSKKPSKSKPSKTSMANC